MQGEGNQKSLNIMGDVDFGMQWPTDEEAEPRHTSNDIPPAEDPIHDPDQIAQPDRLTNLSIPESPKDHSTYSHHGSFSDTGLAGYNLEYGGQEASNLLGMTGGSESWTVPTPIMDSTSLQLHPFSGPPAIHQNYQGQNTNDDYLILSDVVPDNPQPTLRVWDHDPGFGHHRFADQEWYHDGATNETIDGEDYQTPIHNDQPAPGPWSPFAVRIYEHGPASQYNAPTAEYHAGLPHETPISERSFTYPSTSERIQTVTPATSIPADSYPPLPDRSRPWSLDCGDSNNTFLAYGRTEVNLDTLPSIVGDSGHASRSGHLSRSSSNRLSVPGTYASNPGPSSPTPSQCSITPSNVEAVLECEILGCTATFSGHYRRGNRQRHYRMKHGYGQGKSQGHEERIYRCEALGCQKVYKRQDARLKHYRKRHPHLAPGPALSRRQFSSM